MDGTASGAGWLRGCMIPKCRDETIQAILRHSDPKVTQDSYIVIKSDGTRKAMQRVDDGEVLKAWRKTRSQNSR